ncbi:hypothetical protein H4Q26_012737 [Puccinia striiformis f. sp. tritici PST-130]|nr:hypothetical protein Pst134EB_028713 [Puccinia striiformis f. sp. tritici]KAI9617872.1 hypothetical protein H4Q26_012737 [Puccinia striiformis f. sp. tritici PST-130]
MVAVAQETQGDRLSPSLDTDQNRSGRNGVDDEGARLEAETEPVASGHTSERSEELEFDESEEPSESDSDESEEESESESDDSEEETDESEDEKNYGPVDWKVFDRQYPCFQGKDSNNSWSQGLLVHANKRIVELILDTRQALESSLWGPLWRNVQELDKWLSRSHSSDRLKSLGLLLPMLSRVFADIERLVIHEPLMSSKVYRQGLDRDEAKALSVMQQKWPKLWKQEMNVNFQKLIQQHLDHMPRTIAGVYDSPTRIVLDCLERILLRLSSRIGLSNLRLTVLPAALLDLEAVTSWYLSFGPIFCPPANRPIHLPPAGQDSDANLEVKSLDLSGNKLTELPHRLPSVLPGLQKLKLSGNPLRYLPASVRHWEQLKRLRVDPPMRRPTGRRRLAHILARASDPPTLVESCMSRLMESPAELDSPAVHTGRSPLPAHLARALQKGRLCDHCHRFRWPAQRDLYLPGRFLFVRRGFTNHISVLLGPVLLCPSCLLLHRITPTPPLDLRSGLQSDHDSSLDSNTPWQPPNYV